MRWAEESPVGFVYLRRQRGVGYCFGRCKNLKQRNGQYRKPNPLIAIPVDEFQTRDMFAAERELIARLARFCIYPGSNEWARESPEVLEIWESVKGKHRWRPNVDGKYYPYERQVTLF